MADNKFSVELEVVGNAAKKITEISESVDGLQKSFKEGFDKAGTSFEVFKGTLAAAGVEKLLSLTADAAHKLFDLFVTDGVKAAIDQEEAVNKLNQALALSGEYSKKSSEDFIAFAESLQDTSTYSNDAILSTGALIESLGSLSEDGLKDATLAAANLASQLGVDLETAARKLGVAAEGNVASLKKYGVTVEEGATKAETFANAIEAINEKFGGSAQARTQTFAGGIKQIGNNFDDLVKVTGEAIVKNNVVVAVFGEVNKILKELVTAAEQNKDALKTMVAQGIILAMDATVAFAAALDGLYRIGVLAFNSLRGAVDIFGLGLITAFGGPIAVMDDFLSKLPGIGNAFGSATERVKNAAFALSNDLQESMGKTATAITTGPTEAFKQVEATALRLRESAVGAFAEMKAGVETTVEPINQAKTAVEELTEAQIKLGQEGLAIREASLKLDPAADFKNKSEALVAAREQDLITEEQYNSAIQLLEEEKSGKLFEQTEKMVDKYRAANKAMLEDTKNNHQQEIDANNAKIQKLAASDQLSATGRLLIQKKLSDDTTKVEEGRLQAGQAAIGKLATFQNSKVKEIAAVGKAAAIAQTTIDTYKGATAAYASLAGIPIVGPALGAAAAATFIAAGLSNIAVISGVQLASGIDEVPGLKTGRDSYPAMLMAGERVVPTSTNQDLKAFLADSGGLREGLSEIAARLDRLQNQVVVNIGSREIVNEINDAVLSGRALA